MQITPAHAVADVVTPQPLATQPVAPAKPGPGRLDNQHFDAAAKRVLATDANARIARDGSSNAAVYLGGNFPVSVKPGLHHSADSVARSFLADNGALFGLTDPNKQLKLVSVDQDAQGFSHYKYQQVQDGAPVFGQQLIVHSKGDVVTAVAGHVTPNIESAHPTFAAQGKVGWYTLESGVPRLAYERVMTSRDGARSQTYIDAITGAELDSWSLDESVLNRETHDEQNKKVVLKEGDKPSGDAALDAAHEHAKDVYDFYHDKFGRDSIDGRGMKIISNVHHGNKFNNAFWNGSTMTYGDGDGKIFIPFSLAGDVVGHEMTHGVTERSAGLRYLRQSGALNESWSDVMGNLIEKWADQRAGKPERDPKWLIGEEIFTPDVEGDALRSMAAPGTAYKGDDQPANMKDYHNTPADNGGVHTNSGIPNKAAYEVVQAIGQDKTAEVWYRALTKYLTPSSQFADAANATVQAAIDLYGADAPEVGKVASAWTGVGVKVGTKLV